MKSKKKSIKFLTNGWKNSYSKSISKALNYNEQKVVNGKAKCIHASGFIKAKTN